MLNSLFQMLVFPGFIFLIGMGLVAEYVDRKLHARLQNRVGPPFLQPLADFIKLLGKEVIIPSETEPLIFKLLPVFAVTATITAFFYIPLWQTVALYSFSGDVIVILYLLTIPTLCFFLAGWYSTSIYSILGAVRTITQLFAYEVPLFMGILSACLLADSWSLSEVARYYQAHPLLALINIPGFIVCLISLMGKLEKVPFDIPDAETEIVAGTFTEYSGKYFALFRLTLNIEMIVGAALLGSVFFPFFMAGHLVLSFVIFLLKILFIIMIITLVRTIFARLRIDQMVNFCWKYLAPLALIQLLINLIVKGMVQ
jgi:NADH-quinone oxidoreductase subunit H